MEKQPSDSSVMAYNKAKAEFSRDKLHSTRQSWHNTTAAQNLEKDYKKLWTLTRTLNEDNPGRRKTVVQVNQQTLCEKQAAHVFADIITLTALSPCPEKEQGRSATTSKTRWTTECMEPCMHDPLRMDELEAALTKLKPICDPLSQNP